MRTFDVVVAGGGAAGLMAAGTAARNGKSVLLLEKMEKPGRKIRITGKGRCNVTNTKSPAEFLAKVRSNREAAEIFLRELSNRQTVDFFERNGVGMVRERGDRVFPASNRAWDVADALVGFAKKSGAVVECHARLKKILTEDGAVRQVEIVRQGKTERVATANVILATGGLSYPATGSTGEGHAIAASLGHTLVPVRPSLVPLETDKNILRPLAGLQLRNVKVSLCSEGQPVAEEFGEMEFLRNALSGAVILRLSRDAVDSLRAGKKTDVSIDLKPALSETKLTARIERELAALPGTGRIRDLVRKLVPAGMIDPLCRKADLPPERRAAEMTVSRVRALVAALKNYRIPLTGYRPFEEAIVTAGGVDLAEVDPDTLQSRIIRGLYFAGELLDIDADTGGYNLQLAFSSGRLAGQLKG